MWYDYNHTNLRTYKRIGDGAGRQFVYNTANQLLGEYTDAGVAINEYIYLGGTMVAVVNGGITYRVITDHLNTPRIIYNPNTHARIWIWQLGDAFGNNLPRIIAPAGFEFNVRFAGQYYDAHNGLFYNHHRNYNPKLGRYMEPDPIGLAGGLNPYVYAGDNPIMASDPSGLFYSPGMSDFDMSNTYGSPDLTWQVNAQNNSIRIANQTYNSSYNVSVSSPTYTASANLASGGSRSNSGSSSGLVVRDYGTTRDSVYAGLKADFISDVNSSVNYLTPSRQTVSDYAGYGSYVAFGAVLIPGAAPVALPGSKALGAFSTATDPSLSSAEKIGYSVSGALIGGYFSKLLGITKTSKAAQRAGVEGLSSGYVDTFKHCRQQGASNC